MEFMIQYRNIMRVGVLMVVAGIVIALTTLPNSAGIVSATKDLFAMADHPSLHDALGHATLYAMLTAALYWALERSFGFHRGFVAALLTALALALATELFQQFAPGRSVQLSDLLGNWMGVMSVSLVICFRQTLIRQPTPDR